MAVHAHPDDESSSTGGVLARYADEGVRTVVVTCTNGELGDAPGGIKPGESGHDETEVARIRLGELERACETLGVAHLELLGYHDSGMVDWADKDRPDVFCNVAVSDAVERLSSLFEEYKPDVVITYDALGGYDHPDHLHASRAAVAAVKATGIPSKLYLTAMRRSRWAEMWQALKEAGQEVPDFGEIDEEAVRRMDESEARITTTVDIRPEMDRKNKALRAHASQIEESWFSKIPPEVAVKIFGDETFIRAMDRTGAPVPETDLFAGLR